MIMEKPAQVIQDAQQPITDLHNGVAQSLGVSPGEVNPNDQSSLEKLKETGAEILDVAQSVGTHVSDKIGGEATQIRVSAAKRPSLMSRIRTRMKVWK